MLEKLRLKMKWRCGGHTASGKDLGNVPDGLGEGGQKLGEGQRQSCHGLWLLRRAEKGHDPSLESA